MARFQDEGGVVADGTFYVEREADRTLLDRLREGRLCVVLAPRQIGKSSLRDRTQRRLADAGITAVHLDISAYTTADATEHWFYGGVIREMPACLSVFRIADDGRLDFVRKYDVEVGNQQMFWMGMVTL